MRRVGKTGATLFVIQCGAIALLFGGYMGLKGSISDLKSQARSLEERLASAELAIRARQAPAPGSTVAPFNVEPIQLDKAITPASSAGAMAPSGAAAAQPPKSVADAIAETIVCVDTDTHAVIPCERAVSCLGIKGFNATYFNGLRVKLGISGPMMVCNMKATESGTPPAPSE